MEPELTAFDAAAVLSRIETLGRRMRNDRPSRALPLVVLAVLVCVIIVGPFLSVALPGDLIVRGMSPLFTVVVALASWARGEKRISL